MSPDGVESVELRWFWTVHKLAVGGPERGRSKATLCPEKQKRPLEPAVPPVLGNGQVSVHFPVGALSVWQTEEP